jgi:hypothetical protein
MSAVGKAHNLRSSGSGSTPRAVHRVTVTGEASETVTCIYHSISSEPHEVSPSHFENISGKIRSLFDDPRFSTLEATAGAIREEVLGLVPSEIQSAEDEIRQRIGTRRATAHQPTEDPRALEVIENLLISREIVRAGLGMDLIIAQPRA